MRCCAVLACAASQLVDAPTVDSELISVLAGDYADEFDDARYFLVRWCTCTWSSLVFATFVGVPLCAGVLTTTSHCTTLSRHVAFPAEGVEAVVGGRVWTTGEGC